ncbi:glycosyltransferase [Arthrobacter oryzae]|uniref:glycosyltransferase n=1 Tax=Arthrobacter oryzae TaxID=409290 RepID=UPI0030C9F8FA
MPLARFPRKTAGLKIVFLTDDWLEGSRLMGLSRAAVRRVLESNLSRADGIAAVSEELLIRLGGFRPADAPAGTATAALTSPGAGCRPAHAVIPNGCPEPPAGMPAAPREPAACLVGQLNERLDLDVLEAVQAAGIAMTVIGPRTDRNPAYGRRLDAFLAAENVHWMGELSAAELGGQLARFGAGMTPYADSSFNRASFPLKTLEYLSAGLGVVSTDIPSARWLNTGLISLRSNPQEFALAVKAALAQRNDGEHERLRKQFAAGHTWAARAVDFQHFLDRAGHHRAGPGAAVTAGLSGEDQA